MTTHHVATPEQQARNRAEVARLLASKTRAEIRAQWVGASGPSSAWAEMALNVLDGEVE